MAIRLPLITIITGVAFDCCCHTSLEEAPLSSFVCVCVCVCVRKLQVLKGGHEAPTKPKGRPKKNSIPTTEEIEAEERRVRLEQGERMRRAAGDAALACGGGEGDGDGGRGGDEAQQEPQDLSMVVVGSGPSTGPAAAEEKDVHSLALGMQVVEHHESPLPMQPGSPLAS